MAQEMGRKVIYAKLLWCLGVCLGLIYLFCIAVLPILKEPSGFGMTISDTRSEVEKRNEERRLFVEKNPEGTVLAIKAIDGVEYFVVNLTDGSRARIKNEFNWDNHFLVEAEKAPLLIEGDRCATLLYDVYQYGRLTDRKGVGLRRIGPSEKEEK